jgi:hypothetical protein
MQRPYPLHQVLRRASSTKAVLCAAMFLCFVAISTLAIPQALVSVTIAPDQLPNVVVGGDAVTGTVKLDAAAPAGGVTVTLSSSAPALATVPANVTVPEGASTATFTVTTAVPTLPTDTPNDGEGKPATISAMVGGTTKTAVIQIFDDVTQYAKNCYQRLLIKDTDFPGPFQCKAGKQLVTMVNGVIQDITLPNGMSNPNNPGDFPATCDFPAWLPNGGKQCYGGSFIQQLSIAGNKDFRGALLCRHKAEWAGVCVGANVGAKCAKNTDCGAGGTCTIGDKDFPDIAMILHNKDNGETCWFQTNDDACQPGERRCDGSSVPAPHTTAAKQFFLPPKTAAQINCVQCHDNGPWMNSRWMNNTIDLEDKPANPYLNSDSFFARWKRTIFVSVKRDGFEPKTPDDGLNAKRKSAEECTRCHKIHAKETTTDDAPFGRDYFTFTKWLDYSIGAKFPPGSNATGQQLDADHALWMPVGHGLINADWQKVFKAHIDALRACMAVKGMGGMNNCAVRVPDATNPKPSGSGARLRFDLDNGGRFVREVTSSGYVAYDPPEMITPMTTGTLSWEADANFDACAIEAYFPPGVPPAPGTVGGWNLPDPPVKLGPFTVPGEYRFDMLCENQMSANIIVKIDGATPPFQSMQAIINSLPGRVATNIPGNTKVQTNARAVDPTFVTWRGTNMRSCILSQTFVPPGTSGQIFLDDSGFIPVTLSPDVDQVFLLTCIGVDGISYTTQITIHPTTIPVCDVNEDGKIDLTDIEAIVSARGETALPNDLRDADGDGQITFNDAIVCKFRCTKSNCAP